MGIRGIPGEMEIKGIQGEMINEEIHGIMELKTSGETLNSTPTNILHGIIINPITIPLG